ncbi:MAG: hypothetical protein ACRBG0_19245 [Lewinella sp.]|uniref:hypothetical protein n=1 Tax=Lewinella sp. TaxID=2004506 RepID=UPI003D6BD62C
MKYNPTRPDDRRKSVVYFSRLNAGDKPFEMRLIDPKRSSQQNRYFHLLLGVLSKETGYTLSEIKTIVKRTVCNEMFIYRKPSLDKEGVENLFLKSSADLDSKQMTEVVDTLRHWSSETLGIYLPLPDEDNWLQLENELENE